MMINVVVYTIIRIDGEVQGRGLGSTFFFDGEVGFGGLLQGRIDST